jgi:hypothetical protein
MNSSASSASLQLDRDAGTFWVDPLHFVTG